MRISNLRDPCEGDADRTVEIGSCRVVNQRHEVGPELTKEPPIIDRDIGVSQPGVRRSGCVRSTEEVEFKLYANIAEIRLRFRAHTQSRNTYTGFEFSICVESRITDARNAGQIPLYKRAFGL